MSKGTRPSTDRDMDRRLKRPPARAQKVSGRSFLRDACRSRCAGGLLPCDAFAGSTRRSVGCLPGKVRSRELASVATARVASCDLHKRAFCVRAAKPGQFFFLYFQQEFNARSEALQARGSGAALAIGARHFRTEGDKPFPVPLDDGRELTSQSNSARGLLHDRSLTRRFLHGKPQRRHAFRL